MSTLKLTPHTALLASRQPMAEVLPTLLNINKNFGEEGLHVYLATVTQYYST
jgi:hypothetical protein